MLDTKRKNKEVNIEINVYGGPMYCGKSKVLLDGMQRATYANESMLAILPAISKREERNLFAMIKRNGRLKRYKNLVTAYISTASELEALFYSRYFDRLVIDEAQFFDCPKNTMDNTRCTEFSDCIRKIRKERAKNKIDLVIDVGGLDMDYEGKPFYGAMPHLLAMSTTSKKLEAVCLVCGSRHGTMTQRLTTSTDLVKVGNTKDYSVCCIECHTQPKEAPE